MRTPTEQELSVLARSYRRDGFAYVRNLFNPGELEPLAKALDDGASPGAFAVADSAGGRQELSVWMHLGNDLIGVIPRLGPMVAVATAAIGEPVYHWHSKLSWKRPNTTSRWDWHQDFGFWADDGVDRPDMCTVAIAVGPVNRANGCMQLIRGSHLGGRLDVVAVGQARGTDPTAVDGLLTDNDVELCELAPGDAVVFHGNTLHSSGPNQTDTPRTMLMSSYNALSNPPSAPRAEAYRPHPLDELPAGAIADGWHQVFGSSTFLDPMSDGIDQGYSIDSAGGSA